MKSLQKNLHKNYTVFAVCTFLCSSLFLAGCVSTPKKQSKVSLIANTYISDSGQMLSSLTYTMSSNYKKNDLSVSDFSGSAFTIVPPAYGTKPKSEVLKDAIKNVKTDGKTLTLKLNDIPFTELKDFEIKCSDSTFNAQFKDFTIAVKTVDLFTQDTFTSSEGVSINYYLYMPKASKPVPLMIWEHGGGEVLSTSYEGANLRANRGAVAWIEKGFTTAVLSVQYPDNYAFGISEKPDQLKLMEQYNTAKYELVQGLIKEGKLDPSRIYISGASSGGGAAIRFIMQYPDFFAAALVVCAKDTVIPLSEKYNLAFNFKGDDALKISSEEYDKSYSSMKETMKNYDIKNVPIWFVQALNDQVCTSYTSRMLYKLLQEEGAQNNKLTLYSDQEMKDAHLIINHLAWELAYADDTMLKWVYSQKKK